MEDRPSHRRAPAGAVRILFAIVVAIAGSAGLAEAAGGPSVVEKSKTASLPNDNQAHSVAATCPKGSAVSGGGLKLSDPADDYFQGSYPQGGSWKALGYRPTTSTGSSSVTALAMCLHGATISRKSKTRTLPGDLTPTGVVAKCPKGTRLTGGGVEVGDPNVDSVEGSYPSGKSGWKAVAYRNDISGDSTVTSHALCVKHASTSVAKKAEALKDGGAVREAVARCPKGTVVTGGGARVSDTSQDFVQGSFAQGHRGWAAKGVGPTGTKLTAYALCLKG
jgi:hypothetical protein